MVSYTQYFHHHLLSIIVISFVIGSRPASTTCYTSIISFGDSIADTGNFLLSLGGKPYHIANFPYGETYFHHPTGRFSDGRIIIDFFAEALGMRLVPPFLEGWINKSSDDFGEGVNFAVGGATALGNQIFREMGMDVTWTNYSLGVQMEWFKHYLLPHLCASRLDCNNYLHNLLFLVGEIGGNDYNYMFSNNRSLNELETLVPRVIDAISSTINDLIELGARTLVVPGNFPIGCSPWYLTIFQSTVHNYFDAHTGCINWLNKFAEYHNSMLQEELNRLRKRHPSATFIYADYYNATLRLYRFPHHFGFGPAPLSACCGGGGPYNYNSSAMCGSTTSSEIRVCKDPSAYISWDGIHFTEAAYKTIASGLLNGVFTSPPINHICPSLDPNPMNTMKAHQAL